MDFNFFVINKETLSGLYQYYHQSFSTNGFLFMMKRLFEENRRAIIASELDEINNDSKKKGKELAVRRKHKGALRGSVPVKEDKIGELINELKRVKSFEFSLNKVFVEEPELEPIEHAIKRQKLKYVFSEGFVDKISKSVGGLIDRLGIRQGRVVGLDENNVERVLKIMNTPDSFGEYDYDDVASHIDKLDMAAFNRSWVVGELLKKAKAYDLILSKK